MRLYLFAFALLVTNLAVLPVESIASPMVGHVGRAEVTLSLSPDPPQPGSEHALVSVSGVAPDALDGVKVNYTSDMPAMTMKGSAGSAHAVPGRVGEWEFDLPMSTATQWTVTLNFSGAVNGSTTFSFDVIGLPSQGSGAMDMSGNADGTWRIAAFVLAILFIVVGVIAWNLAKARGSSSRPKWMTPSTAAIAGAAVIAILGLAVIQSKFAPPATDMSTMSNVPGSAPVPVRLGKAGHVQSGTTIVAPGIIEPFLTQNISSRTPGMVQSVDVYVGDKVTSGQTLVTLSEPDLGAQATAADAAARSDYKSATAALIDARNRAPNELIIAQQDARAKSEQARYWRNELQREKSLLDQGGVSSQEYEDERAQAAAAAAVAVSAQRQVDNARATVDMARAGAAAALAKASSSSSSAAVQSILAGYTTLTASDDAVVVARLVDPGSYVDSGTAILRIAVIGKVRIQANVSQEDLAGITLGTPLVATVDGGQPIRARVTAVQPAADPTTHTAMIEASVDNPGDRLRPGSYARVSIGPIAGRRLHGTTTPSASIIGSGLDAAVWTDVNGTAHRVTVSVLSDDGQLARVSGDLKPGDLVVLDGGQSLEEGTPIAESRQ